MPVLRNEISKDWKEGRILATFNRLFDRQREICFYLQQKISPIVEMTCEIYDNFGLNWINLFASRHSHLFNIKETVLVFTTAWWNKLIIYQNGLSILAIG